MTRCVNFFLAVLFFYSSFGFALESPVHRYEAVFQEHVKHIQHLECMHPQLMVFISGAFGMGKSETAKCIEEKFQAICLEGSLMGELLARAGFHPNEMNDYFSFCLHRLHEISNNRMFVIDRTYNSNPGFYDSLAEEYGALAFKICLEDLRETAQREEFDFILDNSQEGFVMDEALFEAIGSKFRFQSLKEGTDAFAKTRSEIISYAHLGKPIAFTSAFSTILPGLYLGNQKSVLEMLLGSCSLDVISCRSKPDKIQLHSKRWLFLQIDDHPSYPIQDHFEEAFHFIEQAENAVFVHCLYGMSRSAALMTSYLMRKFKIPFSVAYAYLRKKHPNTQEISFFESHLIDYESSLQK